MRNSGRVYEGKNKPIKLTDEVSLNKLRKVIVNDKGVNNLKRIGIIRLIKKSKVKEYEPAARDQERCIAASEHEMKAPATLNQSSIFSRVAKISKKVTKPFIVRGDLDRQLAGNLRMTKESEALKGKKPTRNANSKIKVNKEAGPISPVLMD